MLALVVLLLLALVLFGIGFAIKFLWIVAAIVFAVWLVGFLGRGTNARPW
jgi:hypothetical protein